MSNVDKTKKTSEVITETHQTSGIKRPTSINDAISGNGKAKNKKISDTQQKNIRKQTAFYENIMQFIRHAHAFFKKTIDADQTNSKILQKILNALEKNDKIQATQHPTLYKNNDIINISAEGGKT